MRQFNRVAAPLPTRQDNSQLTTPNSQLSQWPCQIRLVPVKAPYFQGAKLLIAADCTAYAYANFHQEFMRGKVTIVGCPKLDPVDYSEKLTEILRENDIATTTLKNLDDYFAGAPLENEICYRCLGTGGAAKSNCPRRANGRCH